MSMMAGIFESAVVVVELLIESMADEATLESGFVLGLMRVPFRVMPSMSICQ